MYRLSIELKLFLDVDYGALLFPMTRIIQQIKVHCKFQGTPNG